MSSKRKNSSTASLHGEASSYSGDPHNSMDSDGQTGSNSRKGSFKQHGSVAGGEAAVTKRTLQNRKAQREFRKRREARVRDLEDRCRRFDQMGLEANVELQRVARNLKEENEALRGFVIRVGYGGMMSSILEGVGHQHGGMDNSLQNTFAGSFGGGVGAANKGGEGAVPQFGQASSASHNRSKTTSSLSQHYNSFQETLSNGSWMSGEAFGNGMHKRATSDEKPGTAPSPSSASTSSSSQNDLLSINLPRPDTQQKTQQTQPEFTPTQETGRSRMLPNAISPNSALQNFLNQANGATDGTGMAGSAMLANYANSPRGQPMNSFAAYPVPQRTHQNEALLNPNPIPFAFNLSNDPPQINASWWEQMGGGRVTPGGDSTELDEKAQAVAAAQTNNGGAQSPFDLSAFLQGGMTPGGGFNLHGLINHDETQDKNKGPEILSSNNNGSETDHMRTFVRLLERKVAEREAQTFASLGFQPPSQDPAQRQERSQESGSSKPQVTFTSALSPSGVYSRLAQHPAFLSTDARELEELVDALGSEAARSPVSESGRDNNAPSGSGASEQAKPIYLHHPSSQTMDSKRSPAGRSTHPQSQSPTAAPSSGSVVEVDERAIERLMGLLDQKRMNTRGGDMDKTVNTPQQPLSMAMS